MHPSTWEYDLVVIGSGPGGHFREADGAQLPVLPMSSTPLPFQWNLTTLGKPIPPEYDSATVSPVHSEVLIPLNPKVSGTPCGMNLPR